MLPCYSCDFEFYLLEDIILLADFIQSVVNCVVMESTDKFSNSLSEVDNINPKVARRSFTKGERELVLNFFRCLKEKNNDLSENQIFNEVEKLTTIGATSVRRIINQGK